MRLTSLRNRGELSEGWYDPSTLQKAVASAAEFGDDSRDRAPIPQRPREGKEPVPVREQRSTEAEISRGVDGGNSVSDSDDSVGPALPGQENRSRRSRTGPSIPNMQDLELKRGNCLSLPSFNMTRLIS